MRGKNATERLQPDAAGIDRAVQLLDKGELVAVPTETVYGLAARADSAGAVAKIYSAKERPDFNPLIVHVADVAEAGKYAEVDERAHLLAGEIWPGPLTLVLPLRPDSGLAPSVTAGLPTIALRCPAHPVMRAILSATNFPLAAPSANRSGSISPTSAEHVLRTLDGRIAAVVDGGASARGLESTIVALREGGEWSLLRPGPIEERRLSRILGAGPTVASGKIEAPGQLARHYAPGKPVRLEAQAAEVDEFLIGFGTVAGDCTLSPSGDLSEAAARLYDCLHLAACSDKPRIAIAPVPDRDLGCAINDRLRRAAA